MADENAPPNLPPPWQQQKFLITDSFRATKRPRDFSPRKGGCRDPALLSSPISRVPLSDLGSNPSPLSLCRYAPSPRAVEADLPAVLDEEFDEAILKEIDAICEQRSSAKREKPPEEGKSSESYSTRQIEGELANAAENGRSIPEAYAKYLESLNEKQREAACSDVSVPLMIIAGPGSGKTSTMVGRVLTLLKEGIMPGNILAMTFTTAAASEMRERISKVTGKAVAKELAVSTFHCFCLQLCRSHAEKLNRTPEFLIYGHGQQRRAVIESLRVLDDEKRDTSGDGHGGGMDAISFKEMSKKWQKFVTQAKASGRTPEDIQKKGDNTGAKILQNYESIKASCNALDYHDFISCSVKLLTDFPEVYTNTQDQWKAIVVDEFQDTSSMQYRLLQILGSHNRVTVIGDEDQSIFSFNGADVCGFDSFCRDFRVHKEVRLCKNYRSTRCIVAAASSLIHNNVKRCQQKQVVTENASGCKIVVKECYTEDTQCAFVIDRILEMASERSDSKCSFNDFAILYRRQVTGSLFQASFRDRKIPFNNHGVAFYRKKVVKAIIAILKTTIPGCGDGPFRQAFKTLLLCDKEVKKKMIGYIDKISSARNCSFFSAAFDIFSAKISGTFKRAQLTLGRKVLSALGMLSKLVSQESSISSVISSAANLLPQKYLLEGRAVIDVDNGKYLNEDHDLRSVLQFLLDDVAEFHSSSSDFDKCMKPRVEENGCQNKLCAFLDHISLRETEHFRALRSENQNSVTLTTIHQSKGLEWDTVFIVKANESEIPLSNEYSSNEEGGTSIEEERRLMYVAMTRARKKLYILHVLMDSHRMLLQPSRFLTEIPAHLTEGQEDTIKETLHAPGPLKDHSLVEVIGNPSVSFQRPEDISNDMKESPDMCLRSNFLKRFCVEDRSTISQLFHQWARKQAFQIPRRLIDKVGFVIDERLRSKTTKNKELLRSLKALLNDEEAIQYAQYVLRWETIPLDKRAHLMREKQEHFQRQRIETSMSSSAPSAKQVNYLQSLGCNIVPTSRLHASRLIEQYKSL